MDGQTWLGVVLMCVALSWAESTVDRRGSNMGFVGMRGKKSPSEDGDDLLQEEALKHDLLQEEVKRGSMGFVGMRGKKDIMDLEETKRAVGFVGMRGKKDPRDYLFNEEEKRAKGFMGMRGKKDLYGEEGLDKRAMGFMGMRGKKFYDFDYPDQESYEKRAMGFQGMRGKKSPAGFVGMRGKKDEDFSSEDLWLVPVEEMSPDKRAAGSSSFYGMRGKKAPAHSSFLG
uniref:Tachykinin n=1 Tax=Nilaparvata lugens TaxID=108931 RepID=U3U907_NILLU|nr:tachykinin [Nilaparvata lugens]